MASKGMSLNNSLISDMALSVYEVNSKAHESVQEELAIHESLGLLSVYQRFQPSFRKDTLWGQNAQWPDADYITRQDEELTARQTKLRNSRNWSEAYVQSKLQFISQFLVGKYIETPTPRVGYLPTQRLMLSGGVRTHGIETKPLNGKIVKVALDGWVPAEAYGAGYHGEGLPAVTIKHRMKSLSDWQTFSTLPLVVLDDDNKPHLNFA